MGKINVLHFVVANDMFSNKIALPISPLAYCTALHAQIRAPLHAFRAGAMLTVYRAHANDEPKISGFRQRLIAPAVT